MFNIEENLKNLPDRPGVYLHRDQYGEVIYVGKAASLKNRVRQYFRSPRNMDAKMRAMVSHISEFEYIITVTEMEALILENNLIKKHMPKYNVLLRDDKTYPYIKVTMGEEYPRLLKTRILANDGSRYYGPYADVKSVNQIIDLLSDIYRLKRCALVKFPENHRPCLNMHIQKCRGVCAGGADRAEYMKAISAVNAFLSGRDKEVVAFLKKKMDAAAENLDFENAAQYRDSIQAAASVMEKQRVVLLSAGDMDIVLAARGETNAHVVVFFVRDGRLSGRESHHLQATPDDSLAGIVAAFIGQYYINTTAPKEILTEEELPDQELIAEWLTSLRGGPVNIHTPMRGDKKALLDLARKDIAGIVSLLDERAKSQREKDLAVGDALRELISQGPFAAGNSTEAVGAAGPENAGDAPAYGRLLRVEAYDISNTGGVDSVGVMVVFEGSRPVKKDYRRFRIRTIEGADDYGSIQEALYRRLKRGRAGDPGFAKMPDLILLDGGRGHVNAALQLMSAMKESIPVAGMVKDDRHRTRGLVCGDKELDLKRVPALYHFIGIVQEEVHRFAIEYHRNVRGKTVVRSELDGIEGIGPKRRNALLRHFGSLEKIKNASDNELLSVSGMTKTAAKKVRTYFFAAEGSFSTDNIDNSK
ncbi:MAG: excinuclease ABC subunit UvrC [Clostridiales Family XIII bacterium]|jgi:excinuclease ABC subunit C|nr:excinuclease ABC subunit UvrC [Clostridiales Family XIII bacterium]